MNELQVVERFCACGTAMQIEYSGSRDSADAAIAQMFDELHHTPRCGAVTPQLAAIARSELARMELHARTTDTPGSGTPRRSGVGDDAGGQPVADPAPTGKQGATLNDTMQFLSEYEMLFPDYKGDRSKVILAVVMVLDLPRTGHYRSRDAWIESSDNGKAHIRLVCKLGGPNRESHQESIETLRANPSYLTDFDETFNNEYASFLFTLPESLSVEARAEMATHAVPSRNLAAEAEASKNKFAWSQ